MQDYVTPLPLGALFLAHAACAAALTLLCLTRAPSFPGWRRVGPSGTHWFCFAGSWSLAALVSWVWLFVGSSRSDAALQMHIAHLLALAFCAAGAWSGFHIAALRRTALRWRGNTMAWRAHSGERRQAFTDFDAIRRRLDGALQVRFRDQTVLTLDPHASNADAFLARLSEAFGEDIY